MNITLLIILCALVTFIPRVIPAIFMERLNFSPKFEKFLCPGVLTVDPNLWYIGLIGAVIAGGLAWKKVPLGAIVILTVIVLVAVYLIVPFFPVLI